MKLRLVYLLLALLAAAVAATVYVQVQRAIDARHRREIEAAMAPVLENLRLPEEVLRYDGHSAKIVAKVTAQARQWRDAANPTSWPATSDEGSAVDYDESRISEQEKEATDACATIIKWVTDTTTPVGAYFKRHPDFATEKLRPPLLAIVRSQIDNDVLRYRACRTLYLMGERSSELADSLERVAHGFAFESEIGPCGGSAASAWGVAKAQWAALLPEADVDAMLKSLGRMGMEERDFEYQFRKCPEYEDAAPRVVAQKTFLPPGATYVLGDCPFRCPGNPQAITFSPDGKLLAAGIGDAVCLWSVPDGQLLNCCRLKGVLEVMRLDFGPRGEVIALVNAGHHSLHGLFSVRPGEQDEVSIPQLWTWQPQQAQARPLLPGTQFAALAIGRDGKVLAAGETQSPIIHLFDPDTGQQVGAVTPPPRPPTGLGGPDAFTALAFSEDGKNLVGCRRGKLQVISLPDGAVLREAALCKEEQPLDLRVLSGGIAWVRMWSDTPAFCAWTSAPCSMAMTSSPPPTAA